MSNHQVRSSRNGNHTATTPSPLRHASNASNSSTETSSLPNPFAASRNSIAQPPYSVNHRSATSPHKRPIEVTSPSKSSTYPDYHYSNGRGNPNKPLQSERQSLRPLQQAPNGILNASQGMSRRLPSPERTEDIPPDSSQMPKPQPASEKPLKQAYSVGVRRSDSVRAKPAPNGHQTSQTNKLESSDLEKLGRSATGHLRALSKFAEQGEENDFSITSPEQEVAGLHGRRRLQRSMSNRNKKTFNTPGYGGKIWMDQQRQYLQAYEYLCHIGEAKEWIEDVIHKPIPPIIQLEEALRDGVTLAEIVQAIKPAKPLKIFRNAKLQFRHSDNIATFFKFLAEIELPELFRFELVDLYEKKNIPKVIYCIHALSWLLLRKGIIDFRIGNLVGQLEFEHHELEATQKGLDKAGVSMPNFSGMRENLGAPPEPPQPLETEEEQLERKLREQEHSIFDVQTQIRGALLRMKLGDTMQDLWDDEELLVDLQSRIRGDFARQISEYKQHMKSFAVGLQSISRGFLARSTGKKQKDFCKSWDKEVLVLQSHLRARPAQKEARMLRSHLRQHDPSIRRLQASIRGMLTRSKFSDWVEETRKIEPSVSRIQSHIRGLLSRKRQADCHIKLAKSNVQGSVVLLQATLRSGQSRQKHDRVMSGLRHDEGKWINFQATARSRILRLRQTQLLTDLTTRISSVTFIQSAICGFQQRTAVSQRLVGLLSCEESITRLESVMRAYHIRRLFNFDLRLVHSQNDNVTQLQAAARGSLLRSHVYDLLCQCNEVESDLVALQSLVRASSLRTKVGNQLENLEDEEEPVAEFQALTRASLVRKRFAEKKRFYNENMKRVIKVQSFVRARQQGDAYKSLTSGKNPPVNTVKNFVHLLNDSDFDFDEEVESEKLRKAVGTKIRENEQTEQWITELDAKIGLLAQNKIARDEFARHYGGGAANPAGRRSTSQKDTFNLKSLNKTSRAKLELYQEMFCILQTDTKYLARLFKNIREQGVNEEESRRLEMLTVSTFGFAQKRREEYYLLKLISSTVREEAFGCSALTDFARGTFFFGRLFSNYARAPRDRRYFRDVLGALVRSQVIEGRGLDLESDPLQIYRVAISDEELRTGQRSRRNPDIPREQAIKDPETREIFIRHLQDLRDLVDQFLMSLDEAIPRIPYGARYIAQQMFETLHKAFPREEPGQVLQVVGNWLWKIYLRPALAEPEKSGAIDRGLDSKQRRNLNESVKVINQVAAGRLFGEDNVYLQPLNSYVDEAIGRFNEILAKAMDVPTLDENFEMDVMDDLHARNPPTLFIKMSDVFAMHQMIASHLPAICRSHEDNRLREIARDLGSAQTNESEMAAGSSEVALSLRGKLHQVEDPDADIKALYMETKRCVLYIIRIQAGEHLMEIMVKPIIMEDEQRWAVLVREELAVNARGKSRHRRAYTESSASNESNLADLATMSYAELKGIALENILTLESRGRLTRDNNYQDLLNEIAIDIRQKHKRRQQRRREIENVRATLTALDDKAVWLEEKLKAYNDTFEQNLNVLQNKKGKKRFIMPFSTQWNHERELARLGRVPQYGSYKYNADVLHEKGILVEWKGPQGCHRSLRDVDVTISSDEVNAFMIEASAGSLMLPGGSASFTWDDLLEAQYQSQRFIRFFGEEGAGGKVGEGRAGGPRTGGGTAGRGELVLDAKLFMQQVSKKFWPEG